jgi:general secretion pathway protein D
MKRPPDSRFVSYLVRTLAVVAVLALSACASTLAYRQGNALIDEGKTEPGLLKLEEAVRLDPHNAEYRITLATRRASAVNRLLKVGEGAQRSGRADEAEQAYQRVLALDPDNVMAHQGLKLLTADRRHQQTLIEAEATFRQGGLNAMNQTLERLRPVLSENPNDPAALDLKQRVEQAMAQEQRPETKLAESYRKPISLEFRDAPLRSVFNVIAQVSGLNFFFDNDVRQDARATVVAKSTSIEDAVNLLLTTNQLKQQVLNDNSILIYPNSPQKIRDYQTQVVRAFFVANADVKTVANTLKTIARMQDIVIDERLGILIVRDTPESIRLAERLVALQDFSDPEVLLEVEVLEIQRSRLLELGVEWPSQLTLAPLQAAGSALTLQALKNLSASRTQATIGSLNINANKEDQDTNILANPRIRVRNKEKAKVMIGDRVPVITTTSTATGFIAESVNYLDVGLKLEVEPNVYLDDEVAIKVGLEVSSLVKEITSKAGTLTYQIGSRTANTVLRLKNGETQILAGLISENEGQIANKVPGLGELPIVGRLFGSHKDDKQRSEILLSITPHIVRAIRRPDLAAAEFDAGTDASLGGKPLTISPIQPTAPPTASPEQLQFPLQRPDGIRRPIPPRPGQMAQPQPSQPPQ